MSSQHESIIREPLITGNNITYAKISEDILAPVERMPGKAWWIGFTVASMGACLWVFAVSYTFWYGIGSWGLNKTVGWAWDITGFVWWVGIGHAGTLISAILLLFRQKWRNSINRSAEAMTIFAVICAASYILCHMGRPWMALYSFPLPNQYGSLWVNFNSPLIWDVFAISTYFSVSLVFWYTGLLPDIATIRDRAIGLRRKIYSVMSFGWTGSVKTWQRFETVSLILAGVSTPLVLSVHSIVSMDFATSLEPGWHTTIFPPYFVAGAIFSGFAMVQTLLLITRKVLHLENYITMFHIEAMNKIIILTGGIVAVAYMTEWFIAYYSSVEYEQYAFLNRFFGPYWWASWSMFCCNCIIPQVLWIKAVRRNIAATWFLSIIINIGMWFERFVIIVTSLHRDYIPSSWAMFYPTWIDVSVFIGSIGVFFTLFLLFLRVLPAIAIAEVKLLLKGSSEQEKKKILESGHVDPVEAEFYKNALRKFDSIDISEYEKV
jgi:Ni/Fe-hydrogenase subunit HybB-like protein